MENKDKNFLKIHSFLVITKHKLASLPAQEDRGMLKLPNS